MISIAAGRLPVACFTLTLLACDGGSGDRPETVRGETIKTVKRGASMSQSQQDRRIDYVEFLTSNMSETKEFYSGVFDWEFTDYGPDYTSFNDGRLSGGFTVATEVVAGGPLVVIYAENLEDIESRIRESGGRVIRRIFEFPGGRRFHFVDPSGNELAVWSDQ